MINAFGVEILGTMMACNTVSAESCAKGRMGLIEAFGEETVLDLLEKNRLYNESIRAIATENNVVDEVRAAATVNEHKLHRLRDECVTDWNNITELIVWICLFEGFAIAQCGSLRGIAEGLDHENLLILAEEASSWHYDLLELAEGHLDSMAQSDVVA